MSISVPTLSLLEHPDEWEQRLLHRYYEAMCVSLEIWMRRNGWRNPEESRDIVGDWFDRETAPDGEQVEGGEPDRLAPASAGAVAAQPARTKRAKRVRFATLVKFLEKLKAEEAARREASQLQADLDRMTGEGGPGELPSASAALGDAPARRRRFRDYLFRSLVNYAWDDRRRQNREAALVDEIGTACDNAIYREWLKEQDEPSDADIPLAVGCLGWDISESVEGFADVLRNFKGLGAAIRRRGAGGELPTWWTMIEVSALRPLLLGNPAAPYKTIGKQYGFKDEKHVRNSLAAMWRHIKNCSNSLVPASAAGQELDAADFIRNVANLPKRLQTLSLEERQSMQEALKKALQANFEKLQGLLDEPMAADVRHFDLAQTVESLAAMDTDFTDEDRRGAWAEVLAMSAGIAKGGECLCFV